MAAALGRRQGRGGGPATTGPGAGPDPGLDTMVSELKAALPDVPSGHMPSRRQLLQAGRRDLLEVSGAVGFEVLLGGRGAVGFEGLLGGRGAVGFEGLLRREGGCMV